MPRQCAWNVGSQYQSVGGGVRRKEGLAEEICLPALALFTEFMGAKEALESHCLAFFGVTVSPSSHGNGEQF